LTHSETTTGTKWRLKKSLQSTGCIAAAGGIRNSHRCTATCPMQRRGSKEKRLSSISCVLQRRRDNKEKQIQRKRLKLTVCCRAEAAALATGPHSEIVTVRKWQLWKKNTTPVQYRKILKESKQSTGYRQQQRPHGNNNND